MVVCNIVPAHYFLFDFKLMYQAFICIDLCQEFLKNIFLKYLPDEREKISVYKCMFPIRLYFEKYYCKQMLN